MEKAFILILTKYQTLCKFNQVCISLHTYALSTDHMGPLIRAACDLASYEVTWCVQLVVCPTIHILANETASSAKERSCDTNSMIIA